MAVIDGFTGMEGDGPSRGTEVDSRVAVSSTDALAADVLGARVMGFDAKKILYLSAMTEAGMGQGNLDRIAVLGSRLDECSYRFKNSPLLKFSAALDASARLLRNDRRAESAFWNSVDGSKPGQSGEL